MRGSTTATATARALREKGNKAVSPGGITRCDRSTGRGLQQPGSPGGRHRTSPLSAPGCPGPAPSPAPDGGEPRPSERRRIGAARVHPAPGATTTSVPTAEHREARTTGRARRPRRGRRKAEAPLAAAAPRAAPQAAAAPRSPGGFENRPRGEGGWVAAGGTRRLRRIGHAKPSALAGHSPERHPAYLPDSPPLRTTESPAARGGSSPRGAPVVPAARPPALNRR